MSGIPSKTLAQLRNSYGTVSVDAKEFTDPSSSKRQSGVTIEVKGSAQFDNATTSYVDYDEIESLLKGLDYIVKLDKSATKLRSFQADYRAAGGAMTHCPATFSEAGRRCRP